MSARRLVAFLPLVSLVFAWISPAHAQRGDCGTPNRAMFTFLAYQNPPDVDMERAAKCMDDSAGTGEDREQVASKLKFVLDNRNLYVFVDPKDKDNPDFVPVDPDYVDPASHESKFVLFPDEVPEIYLVKQGDRWVLSEETVGAVDRLFQHTPGNWSARILNTLPPGLQKSFFKIHYWQLIALLIFILAGDIVRRIAAFIAKRLVGFAVEHFLKGLGERFGKAVSRPLGVLAMAGVWFLLLPALQLYVRWNIVAKVSLTVLTVLAGFWLAYRLVDIFCDIWDERASGTDTKLDDQLVPLARKTIKVLVVITGSLFVLQNLNVDVASLLAGLGIGGLAFALAAKDAVANLFGSVTIFSDQPFQIGDWIVTEGVEGVVEEVGFRSTRVRTFYNSLVTIPNSTVANAIIDNLGQRQFRRTTTTLGLTYDTPPAKIQAFCDGVRAILVSNEFIRKDYYLVHFKGFGASSLDIMLYFFLKVDTWNEELRQKHNIFLDILRLAQHLGVEFAFPTQTMHLETVRETQPLLPKDERKADALRDVVEGFAPGGKLGHPEGVQVSEGFYCDNPVELKHTVLQSKEEGEGESKHA